MAEMTMDENPPAKRRRLQMDANACFTLSQTSEGAAPLTNPERIKTSSKEPNRGLYPRERKRHSRHSNSTHFTDSPNKANSMFSKELSDDYAFEDPVVSFPFSSKPSTSSKPNELELPSSSISCSINNNKKRLAEGWMSKKNLPSSPNSKISLSQTSHESNIEVRDDFSSSLLLPNRRFHLSPSKTQETASVKQEKSSSHSSFKNQKNSFTISSQDTSVNSHHNSTEEDSPSLLKVKPESKTKSSLTVSPCLLALSKVKSEKSPVNTDSDSTLDDITDPSTLGDLSQKPSVVFISDKLRSGSASASLAEKPETKPSISETNVSTNESTKQPQKFPLADTVKTDMNFINSLLTFPSSSSGFQKALDLLDPNTRFYLSPKKNNTNAPSIATNSLASPSSSRGLKDKEVVSPSPHSNSLSPDVRIVGQHNQFRKASGNYAQSCKKDLFSSTATQFNSIPPGSYQPQSSLPSDRQAFNSSKRKKKVVKPQSNTLKNYFQVKQSPNKKLLVSDTPAESISTVKVKHETAPNKEKKTATCTESQINFLIDGFMESDKDFAVNQSTETKKKDSDVQKPKSCDPYGLLGTEEFNFEIEEECGIDRFNCLPAEVLEIIFYTLPMQDLALSIPLVCKQWHDTIANKQFMPWKKKYFQIKSGNCPDVVEEIRMICCSHKMNTTETCLPGFINFMKNFKNSCPPSMNENLKHHPNYKLAIDVIKERVPECFSNKNQNQWCVITMLCIITQTVKGIYKLLECLLYVGSRCLVSEILECFYCIATFFFHFKQDYSLNTGFHYRLYYALYWFENRCTLTAGDVNVFKQNSKGQQSIAKYGSSDRTVKLTHEQLRIVNHVLQPNQIIKIVAFAGTGKTTTLVQITKLWPGKKFLNVVYNKAVNQNAVKLFPSNVTCKTMHSLAYSAVGQQFRGKLKTKLGPFDIMDALDGENKMIRAGLVIKTITKFITTADRAITSAHAPIYKTTEDDLGHKKMYTIEERIKIAQDAEKVWFRMIDKRYYKLKITHDIYLKIYQLSNPIISGFDCLLIDEAQDCNAAMLDILLRQQCPKIIVGDPHQQIYSFRGASNILNELSATHTYYLTQSFRFGPEIAYVASCALEVFKKEHRKTIVGGVHPGDVTGDREGQVAIIARTNFTLFAEAVKICCLENQNIHGAFTGGIKSYNFDQIIDIYNLMVNSSSEGANLPIKDKFISRFTSLNKLQQYALRMDDAELMGKIKIVLTYSHNVPKYISTIKEKCSYPLDFASIVFSTAHKAKGLEFDTVQLCEDFVQKKFIYNRPTEMIVYVSDREDQDEANILYVAITRAKKRLMMSTAVLLMMFVAKEKFEILLPLKYPSEFDELDSESTTCVCCKEVRRPKKDRNLFLKQQEIVLGNFHRIKGGLLCYVCSGNPYYRLSQYLNHPFQALLLNDIPHKSLHFLVGPTEAEREECQKIYNYQEEDYEIAPFFDYIM